MSQVYRVRDPCSREDVRGLLQHDDGHISGMIVIQIRSCSCRLELEDRCTYRRLLLHGFTTPCGVRSVLEEVQ